MLMVFLLVACGSKESNQSWATQAKDVQSQGSGQFTFQGEIPLESKLLFGSLMLEETDMAITPEQAEEVLPLWSLYKTLLESDTTAGAEIDAVMNSIQDAMTAGQMEYIEGMQLGPDDMRQLMDDLGIVFGSRGSESQNSQNFPEGFTPPGGCGGVPGQGQGGG